MIAVFADDVATALCDAGEKAYRVGDIVSGTGVVRYENTGALNDFAV